MTQTERGQENECLRVAASSIRTVCRLLLTPSHYPSSTQLHESALLSSVLSAAITNHLNWFTFGGVIAECVKTVFAP